MAPYTAFHARSISLPSTSHPTESHFDELFSRLRSCESCSTSSSITQKLNTLKDLYVCVDDLLLLPSNVQALSKDSQVANDILEASLSLLDVFGGARDVLSQIKECIQDIQSALRRRCSGNLYPTNEAAAYIKCRKEAKKVVKSLLKSIKNVQKISSSRLENNNAMVDALIKMEDVTAEILESFLAFVAGSKKQSLVSKLIGGMKKEESSEFANMDASVQLIISYLCISCCPCMYGGRKGGLLHIKAYLSDPYNYRCFKNWENDRTSDCCDGWDGVSCGIHGRVATLSLTDCNSAQVQHLNASLFLPFLQLTELDLSQLKGLQSLKSLSLRQNNISGLIQLCGKHGTHIGVSTNCNYKS